MKASRLLSVVVVCVLLATVSVSAGATPLAEPCTPGNNTDPACRSEQGNQVSFARWLPLIIRFVDANHNHLGQTWTGINNPLKIEGAYGAPDYAPLLLSNSSGDGLRIPAASRIGVWVESAGFAGVGVSSSLGDGIRVGSAAGSGVWLGSTGETGVKVESAGYDGMHVVQAVGNGVAVGSAGWNGVYVGTAGDDGVEVVSAGATGVYVGSAGATGVYVGSAAYGVSVGSASYDGVYVDSAGDNGVYVDSAGDDGVHVQSAGYVGVYANTRRASHEWGFYTDDKIHGSNVALSSLTLVAQVTGTASLAPGDVVGAAGLAAPLPDSNIPLPQVRLADRDTFTSIVGVVEGRMALTPQAQPAKESDAEVVPALRSADGPARPGDYVAITVLGAAQVKVQDGETILAGQRLTAVADGSVRSLQTRTLDGMVVTEGASVIGVALEPAKDGMVWVLVNPQ